jgi:hypothetical protein
MPATKAAIVELVDIAGSVEVATRAILLGSLRKLAARVNHDDESPVRSLKYFIPLISEVKRVGDSNYWQHVAARLAREERNWLSSQQSAAPPLKIPTARAETGQGRIVSGEPGFRPFNAQLSALAAR